MGRDTRGARTRLCLISGGDEPGTRIGMFRRYGGGAFAITIAEGRRWA